MMVSSAVIAEDMVKWNMYALTMPVTRRIMVKEKYFLSILFNVCGILLASLYGLVSTCSITSLTLPLTEH